MNTVRSLAEETLANHSTFAIQFNACPMFLNANPWICI